MYNDKITVTDIFIASDTYHFFVLRTSKILLAILKYLIIIFNHGYPTVLRNIKSSSSSPTPPLFPLTILSSSPYSTPGQRTHTQTHIPFPNFGKHCNIICFLEINFSFHNKNMWCFPFCSWFISLTTMSSSYIHAVVNYSISLFFMLIVHRVSIPHFLYLFICQRTSTLISCLDYCK